MSENLWKLPNLGLGLGLRTVHYGAILEGRPAVDWFEIITENYLDIGGRPMQHLDRIAARYPMVMHGVSLSIGSTDPLDLDYLAKVKALAARIDAVWLGDHVCWTGVNGRNGHDLFPMPYTEESLAWMVDRIRRVQDILERPLVLENPSTYVGFKASTMPEYEFLRRMAEDADCALLLDVNNVYVTSRNHDDIEVEPYLDAIPMERVVQLHIAGHTDNGTHCLDTHDHPVPDAVWEIYAEVQRRSGGRATLLEWDDHIPPFERVYEELQKARQVLQGLEVET